MHICTFYKIRIFFYNLLQHEKCPSTDFFLARIQSGYRKIRARKNSVFGHFCRSVFVCYCIILHVNTFICQKQPPEVFCKKSVFRNLAKFTGKQLCQRLSIKLQALGLRTLFYRTPPDGCF